MRESRTPVRASPPRLRRPTTTVMSEEDLDVIKLLHRMREGDREASAIFVTRYQSRIRRRIRGKLNPAMRRLFDSQDIVSTVGRRLDQFVSGGQLEASNLGQLWSLVFRMATNAVIDKSRMFRRLQEAEGPDGAFAHELLRRFRRAERQNRESTGIEIDAALRMLPDEVDQDIFLRWLAGDRHNDIAMAIGMSHDAVRKRWQKIRERFRERFLARGPEE